MDNFDDETVKSTKELYTEMIDLAYSLSIHKSQGSEWNYIVIFIPSNPANKHFLTKNMLYTAITRAKKACWLVATDRQDLRNAASKLPSFRCEKLAERIEKWNKEEDNHE